MSSVKPEPEALLNTKRGDKKNEFLASCRPITILMIVCDYYAWRWGVFAVRNVTRKQRSGETEPTSYRSETIHSRILLPLLHVPVRDKTSLQRRVRSTYLSLR